MNQPITNPSPEPTVHAAAHTSGKKLNLKHILLFSLLLVLAILLGLFGMWHATAPLRAAFLGETRSQTGVSTPQGYDELHRHISRRLESNEPMHIRNSIDEDQIGSSDEGVELFLSFVNRLNLSDQALSTIDAANERGYAQNPRHIISFSAPGQDYLFIQGSNNIQIVRINDGAADKRVAQLKLTASDKNKDSERFEAMFIVDNRLVTIQSPHLISSGQVPTGWHSAESIARDNPFGWNSPIAIDPTFSIVKIYDISVPASPEFVEEYVITGTYSGSRMVGTRFFMSTSHGVYDRDALSQTVPESFIPHVTPTSGQPQLVKPENIRMVGGGMWGMGTTYTHLTSFDIAASSRDISQAAILGTFDNLATSTDSLFLSFDSNTWSWSDYDDSTQSSYFIRIALDSSGINITSEATIPGAQGTLYANDDYLYFFPTYSFSATGSSSVGNSIIQVLVLNRQLEILGEYNTGKAPDDIQPMTFMGDYLYLSSYNAATNTDHFSVFDLRDPQNPSFKNDIEALFMPFTILPWKEQGAESDLRSTPTDWLMLDTKFDERFRNMGNQLSIIDQSDPLSLRVTHSTNLEDLHADEALRDANLIFTYPERGIIALPFDNTYYVFSYSPEDGFAEIGHTELSVDLRSWDFVRATIIGDSLIIAQFGNTIEVWSYNLTDFTELYRLTL